MPLKPPYHRVSKAQPCRICEHPDWCAVEGDPTDPDVSFCQRVPSDRRAGGLGYAYDHRVGAPREPRRRRRRARDKPKIHYELWAQRAREARAALCDARLAALAGSLGLSEVSLRRLGVGWSGLAWTFPMVDANGRPIGLRLRGPRGLKFCARGSTTGLFLPDDLGAPSRLLIAEGTTDTAALLDVGLPAIGRASCDQGRDLLRLLIQRLRPSEVAILGDNDSPGRRGATRLADDLAPLCPAVVVHPPAIFKDIREAVCRGLSREWIEAAADSALGRMGGAA